LTHKGALAIIGASANITLVSLKEKAPLRAAQLFLWLLQGTAFRRQGIEYSLFRALGQISAQKLDAQESQPNHKVKQGKHQCIRRLQRTHPNLQRWLFHEFPVSGGAQRVPKLYVRYVRRQLGVWFENQGQ
jgi:hypothetical protein